MNLEGEVTFVTAAAADLLGTARGDLIGALPWEALPWLSDLVYEDSYRRALFTRLPTSFTALRPPMSGCPSASSPARQVSASV